MGFSRYNRDRPFLIVSHIARPSQGQKTNVESFLAEGKWDVDESIIIVDRVSNKHMTNSSVIIDILKRDLVKNRFTNSHTEEEVIKHYLKKYNSEVAEGIQLWTKNRIGGGKQEAEKLIKELENELNQIEIEIENEKAEKNSHRY